MKTFSPPWPDTYSEHFSESEVRFCLEWNKPEFIVLRTKLFDVAQPYFAEPNGAKPEMDFVNSKIILTRQTAYNKGVPFVGDLNWWDVAYFWDFWRSDNYPGLYIAGPAKLEWSRRDRPILPPGRGRLAARREPYVHHDLGRL